jgi:hypothetical protein
MKRFANKQVVAIGIRPRIDTYKEDLVQEFLNGVHPLSSSRLTEENGLKRKVFLEQSPAGPNETGGAGDRTSHDNVGSGYTQDQNPGGKAKEETGPGNSPGADSDPEQEFTSPDTVNQMFGNEDDLSNKFAPINSSSRKRDEHVKNNLLKMHSRPVPPDKLPRRIPADEAFKRPSRRAAGTNWSHLYV